MGLGHGVVEILEPCSCLSTQLQSSLPSLAMGKHGRIEWEGRDGRIRARIGASSKSWKVDEHGNDGALRLAQEWLRGQGSAWVTGRRTVDPCDLYVSL